MASMALKGASMFPMSRATCTVAMTWWTAPCAACRATSSWLPIQTSRVRSVTTLMVVRTAEAANARKRTAMMRRFPLWLDLRGGGGRLAVSRLGGVAPLPPQGGVDPRADTPHDEALRPRVLGVDRTGQRGIGAGDVPQGVADPADKVAAHA